MHHKTPRRWLQARRWTIVCLTIVSCLLSIKVLAAEQITDYNVFLSVQTDASLLVGETWRINFSGQQRQEIEKVIPVVYDVGGSKYYVRLSDFSVKDENDNVYKTKLSYGSSDTKLIIDSGNRIFEGTKTFYVSYKAFGAVRKQGTSYALTWNATGNGWKIGILNAKVSITVSGEPDLAKLAGSCSYGEVNKTAKCSPHIGMNKKSVLAEYYAPKNLYPYESLNTYLVFPSELIRELSLQEKAKEIILSHWSLLLPFLSLVFSAMWRKRKARKSYGNFAYAPPTDLTPLEVFSVVGMGASRYEVAAELFYLASKNFLSIEITKDEVGVGDYWLIKHKDYTQITNEFDRLILASLFDGRESVLLSTWQRELPDSLSAIISATRSSVADKGYGLAGARSKRWVIAGFVALLATAVFFMVMILKLGLETAISCGLVLLIFAIFAATVTWKSKERVALENEIEGYCNYLSGGQADARLTSNVVNKNPELLDLYMPYAIILGLGKEWAGQFGNINIPQPGWYRDPFVPEMFNSYLFYNGLVTFAQILNGDLILNKVS